MISYHNATISPNPTHMTTQSSVLWVEYFRGSEVANIKLTDPLNSLFLVNRWLFIHCLEAFSGDQGAISLLWNKHIPTSIRIQTPSSHPPPSGCQANKRPCPGVVDCLLDLLSLTGNTWWEVTTKRTLVAGGEWPKQMWQATTRGQKLRRISTKHSQTFFSG